MTALPNYPTVQNGGVVTHVIVPIEDFQRLTGGQRSVIASGAGPSIDVPAPTEDEIARAVRVLDDPATEWHDAESIFWRVVREGLGKVRRDRGITQDELGCLLGLSQAQVSRLESNLEGASVRVLRRIAAVLSTGTPV